MRELLSLGAAAIASAAFFGGAGPAAAKDYEYCRRDVTSFMLQCGFETWRSVRTRRLGAAAFASAIRRSAAPPMRTTTRRVSARRTPTYRFDGNNKEHAFGASD